MSQGEKEKMKEKGRKWDGKSRIATEQYKNNYNEIFKKKEKENGTKESKKQNSNDNKQNN